MSLAPDGAENAGGGGIKKKMTIRTAAAKQRRILHEVDLGAPCLTDPSCPGFELHFWRKRCKHCGCAREEHEVDYIPGRNRPGAKIVRDKQTEAEEEARRLREARENAKNAAPPPEPPRIRSMEERTKLAHQDPEHDHNPDACSGLTNESQISSFNRLNARRNEMYGVGIPKVYDPEVDDKNGQNHKCHRSGVPLKKGDDVVFAPNLNGGEGAFFLADNFTCFCCGSPLLEYNYYEYENEVYCGRCHAEKFMPRCAGCDELIFDPTYTVAENKKWHIVHFCCWVCDVDLCEKKYAKDPEDNPVCIPCFNDKYAVQCGTCKNVITAGERAMRAGDLSYCDTEKCFACFKCKKYLADMKVVQFQDNLYCSPCYKEVLCPPCACGCGELTQGEFVEVRGKKYRQACFKCAECNVAFTREEKKGAYPIGERLLCYTHALAARRAELQAAKEAAAEKEKEGAASAPVDAPADSAGADRPMSTSPTPASPTIVISDEPEPEKAQVRVGGSIIRAAPNTNGLVRQGTKRVSRITRKPSKRSSPTVAEQAAIEEAKRDAETIEEEPEDDPEMDRSVVSPVNIVIDEHDEEKLPSTSTSTAVTPSPQKANGQKQASGEEQARKKAAGGEDPYAAMWAGFSIPMRLQKFHMEVAGREVLEVGQFTLIGKKFMAKVFLVLCTDVALICQKVDDDCYELMLMPVERNKVHAKIVNMKKLPGVVCMKVKMGKTLTLKCTDEVERSMWIGRLNAPIGFVPTRLMMAKAT